MIMSIILVISMVVHIPLKTSLVQCSGETGTPTVDIKLRFETSKNG